MKVIAVSDRLRCRSTFMEQFEKVVRARPDVFALREKDLGGKDYLALAEKVSGLCRTEGVGFCVNGNPGTVAELRAG